MSRRQKPSESRSRRPPHRPRRAPRRRSRASAVTLSTRPPLATSAPPSQRGPGLEDHRRRRRSSPMTIAPPLARACRDSRSRPSPRSAPWSAEKAGGGSARRGFARRRAASARAGRSSKPHHQHLAFGIAEAGIILDQLRPLGGQHQAGIEHAEIRACLASASARTVGSTISSIARRSSSGVQHRRRAVGAHAAGIGAGVAVADALVVLRRAERERRSSPSVRRRSSPPRRS